MALFKWISLSFVFSLTIPALSMTESITKDFYTTVACDSYWWQEASLHEVKGFSENFTSDQIINTFCGDEESSLFHLAAQTNPYPEVIEYLFNMGFYIEDENLLGQNAVILATMNENPEILQTLNALKNNDGNFRGNVNYDVVHEIFEEENTQGFRGPSHEEVKKRKNIEWYRGMSIGTNLFPQAKQEGWNYDTFCYPDEDCRNTPPISGYRWAYDIKPEGLLSPFGELFIGADHGQVRWDIAIAHQQTNIHQNFTDSNSYADPDLTEPITPTISNSNDVSTNVVTDVDDMIITSFAFNTYYDFFESSGTTVYGGIGLGTAHTTINDLHFSIEYNNKDIKRLEEEYPPLPFYNSRQDIDISHFLPLLQFHAGVDFQVRNNKSIGVKLSFSKLGDLTGYEGHYSAHPMHSIDPNFPNYNTFKNIQFLTAMMVFKWR